MIHSLRWGPNHQAPYTRVNTVEGTKYMSKGIVKSVYIAFPASDATPALVTSLVPMVKYLGKYPAAPLTDATKGDFEVRVRVHLQSTRAWQGRVRVGGSWAGSGSAGPGGSR